MGEMSADAGDYFGALVNSKILMLVALVEIAAGLALIFNKFGALLALILMSVSVNAVLFHATLDPGNIAVLYGYKDKYNDLLS